MKVLETNSDMYRIVGCCLKVLHELGSGFSESVYEKALEMELREAGFSVRLHVRIPVFYKGVNLHRDYIADVLVNEAVIVELKAVSHLDRVHENQVMHYLETTGLQEGLLVNFGNVRGLEWRRVILYLVALSHVQRTGDGGRLQINFSKVDETCILYVVHDSTDACHEKISTIFNG